MSSTQSFLRQIPTGLSFYSLPTATTSIYEFVPTTANYVGNYPPGAVVEAVNSPTLAAYLDIVYPSGTLTAGYIMRDMGKTIKASVATSEANALTTPPTVTANSEGFFRQFQILKPVAGNVGGAFGVQGAATVPNAYTEFLTIYVPVTVLGSAYASAPGVYPIAGGQM